LPDRERQLSQWVSVPIATETSIPNLRRGRDTERGPVRSVSTWIRHQKKEPRTLIELKTKTKTKTPLLSPDKEEIWTINILLFLLNIFIFYLF
jgi:hypothetical protein